MRGETLCIKFPPAPPFKHFITGFEARPQNPNIGGWGISWVKGVDAYGVGWL